MTTTYNLATDNGKLRLNIGDTDITNAVFTDEELAVFLATGGSVVSGSARALRAWAAKYGANASAEKIGDYSYQQKTVENMLKLAAGFDAQEAGTPVSDYGTFDLWPVESTT